MYERNKNCYVVYSFKVEKYEEMGWCSFWIKRVLKSLPTPLSSKKSIDNAVKELRNLGFIGIYKKTGEDHVSLNPRKVKDINKFMDEVEGRVEGNDFVE